MSQRIVGLDIGASSIKAVSLETSFRSFQLTGFAERSLRGLPGVESEREARREVLRQMVATGEAKAEAVLCALPGDKVMSRILTLPFTDPKRIESVLGFELEGYLPYGVDEIVYDYQILQKRDDSATIFAAAVRRDFLAEFLEDLKEVGLDPKVVSLDSLSYLNLYDHVAAGLVGPVAIVDVGARTTEVCILMNGEAELVRTVLAGGDGVTTALASDLEVEWNEAELLKIEKGLVARRAQGLGPEDQRLAAACARGLAPVVRDLRQTFQAYKSRGAEGGVARVLLCGGTSRLLGVHEYLTEQLGVPVEPLSVSGLEFNKLPSPDVGEGIIPKGLALSLRAAGAKRHADLNFRQGPFAYQGDFQFLRDKMVYLVLLAIMLLGVGAFKTYARYKVLDDKRVAQIAELEAFSLKVLGKEKDDHDAVLRALKDVPAIEDLRVFPEITATQLFYDITTALQDVNNTSKGDLAQASLPSASAADRPMAVPEPARRTGAPPPGPAQAGLPGGSIEDQSERLQRLREARGAAAVTAPAAGRLHTTRGPELERLRAERLERLRAGQGGIVAPTRPVVPATRAAAIPSPVRGVNPALGNVRAERDAMRAASEAEALAAPGAVPKSLDPAGAATIPGEGDEEGATVPGEGEAAEPARNESLAVELEELRIDESAAFLKGQANTIEALELFTQKLELHRCLRNVVTADTDKVTFPRHQGWLMFRLEITIDCREAKKPGAKSTEEDA